MFSPGVKSSTPGEAVGRFHIEDAKTEQAPSDLSEMGWVILRDFEMGLEAD